MTDTTTMRTALRGVLGRWGVLVLAIAGVASAAGCGPSDEELALRHDRDELRKDVAEQKQYNADLKLRMQLAQARNRVLVDLVKGLTSATAGDSSAALLPAHSSLDALDKDLEELVQSVQHSREDLDAQRAQRASLVSELTQAKHTIEDSRAEESKAQARADAFRGMLDKLAQLIGQGELDARVVQNRLVLQLPEAVLFKSNDARVTRSGKLLLDRVAEVLKSVEGRQFQIAGHTDSMPIRYGEYKDNWELSSERALHVTQYLIERGVPKARLSAAAHGDTQPIADESTAAGRAKNRRIEVVLLPNLEELPDLSALAQSLEKPAAAPGAGDGSAAPPADAAPAAAPAAKPETNSSTEAPAAPPASVPAATPSTSATPAPSVPAPTAPSTSTPGAPAAPAAP